jgi:alpha-galactosidase
LNPRLRRVLVTSVAATVAGFPMLGAAAAPASSPGSSLVAGDLAQTPPLGWNSWNTFACDVDEQLIKDMTDAMVDSGMKEAGYEYVNVDDCWMAPERDTEGRLQADPDRFPSGMAALADYVHKRGLKFGIYSSAGTATCQGLPASLGNEEVDAQSFADWGVDLLKYDNCNDNGVPSQERYQAMGEALAATGRPILYSICEWGSTEPWNWADGLGADMWRTTGDITDSWDSVLGILDQQVGLEQYSGPSAWNDPDMLEVGNPGLSRRESKAHMSLWALMNAPLIAGNDLRSMPDWARRQLTDPDILKVNQDWGGRQGSLIRDDGDVEVWAKPMSEGGLAVAAVVVLNRGDTTAKVEISKAELGLDENTGYAAFNVWKNQTRQFYEPSLRLKVPGHTAKMMVIDLAT